MTDTSLQQLVINVGTDAQIKAGIAGGTITADMLSVSTDGLPCSLTDIATAGKNVTLGPSYTPAYTVVGSPTIDTNFVASGFSDSNYLTCPNILNNASSSFEVITAIRLNAPASNVNGIIDTSGASTHNIRLTMSSNNRVRLRISTNGSETYAVDITGTSYIAVGNKYYVKATYSSSTGYALYTSTDGVNWTTEGTSSTKTRPYSSANANLIFGDNYSSNLALNGFIYLSDTSIKVNGTSYVWNALEPNYSKRQIDSGFYGVCGTAAATAVKDVVCPDFVLKTGAVIRVVFTNSTSKEPSLNVNGTGSILVYHTNGTAMSSSQTWRAGETVTFVYNGIYWILENRQPATTSYFGPTMLVYSQAMTSTSTSVALTPRALRQTVYNLIAQYPAYSTLSTYAVGDRVLYSYNVWECNTAITTAEPWTAAHWTALDPLQKQIDDKIGDIETLLAQV